MKKERMLHSSLVLKLNGCWQAIGYTTPKEAFTRMFQKGKGAVKALDVILQEDGSISPLTQTYSGEEWLELPVKADENFIGLAHGKKVRIPLVTIVPSYKTLPKVKLGLNKRGLYIRDKGICSYCEQQIDYDLATNDHILPASKGGSTSWENCTLACKPCNNKKGDRTPKEANMFPRKTARKPGIIPIMPTLHSHSPREHRAILSHAA